MRVAMNGAVTVEGKVPTANSASATLLRSSTRRLCGEPGQQRAAFDPGHGQEPLRGELRKHLRDMDRRLLCEHLSVKPDVPGFALVIQLLAQSLADLLVNFAGVDGPVDPP